MSLCLTFKLRAEGLSPEIALARFSEYSHPMNNKKLFLKTNKTNKVEFVLGAVLLAALTENVACFAIKAHLIEFRGQQHFMIS